MAKPWLLFLTSGLLLSCAPPDDPQEGALDEDLGANELAVTSIGAVTDQGSWEGRHYFELWGSFPSTSYYPRVVCNGVEVTSRREYHGPERGQINVSIPEQVRGTRCSFW